LPLARAGFGAEPSIVYSVTRFIILASLDNVAIGLVPPLYTPISEDLGVAESAIGLVTAASFLLTAGAAVGWAYVGRPDRPQAAPDDWHVALGGR